MAAKKRKSMRKEFLEFLREYKVVGLAIGFVMGAAAKDLANSVVDDLVMPLINPLIPGGAWQSASIHIGPFFLKWGSFLSNFLSFAIIAIVVFLVVKKMLHWSNE